LAARQKKHDKTCQRHASPSFVETHSLEVSNSSSAPFTDCFIDLIQLYSFDGLESINL
jgi:hypothetical protein